MISPRRFPRTGQKPARAENGALRRLAWYRELALTKMAAKDSVKPRERLLGAAYDLFARNGISKVGIDTILAESGCAKASLYGKLRFSQFGAIAAQPSSEWSEVLI